MDTELSLRDYLKVLRHRWKLMAATFAAVLGAALAYSLISTPMYSATAELLIDNQASVEFVGDTQNPQGSLESERAIETEVRFIQSLLVTDAVEDEVGLIDIDTSARAIPDANVVEITSQRDDAEEAALVANTYAEQYIRLRREGAVAELQETARVVGAAIDAIDEQIDQLDDDAPGRAPLERQREVYVQTLESLQVGEDLLGGVRPQVISAAEVPDSAFSPQTVRNLVLGAVVGMILAIGVALLRETLDTSIRSKSDIEAASDGLPNLALIPAASGWKDKESARLMSLENAEGDAAEAYRTLRTALQFLSLDRELSVIQITSPKPGEGKSTTTSNLAVAFARAGKRVIVVDCDLRKPRLHHFFGVRGEPGVTNLLLGEMETGEAVARPIPDLPILVLPAGRMAPNPSEALGSRATYELFERLRKAADIVLVDTPPVLPVADPRVLADKVDATILVTAVRGSDTHDVSRAIELLRQVNAPLVGTVLNRVGRAAVDNYGYGYSYVADTEPSADFSDEDDDLFERSRVPAR